MVKISIKIIAKYCIYIYMLNIVYYFNLNVSLYLLILRRRKLKYTYTCMLFNLHRVRISYYITNCYNFIYYNKIINSLFKYKINKFILLF